MGNLGIANGYSVPGQLLGHINIGVAMVERAAAELMIADGTKELVQHILLSHHGIPEYGSPKPPMFPEAEIVNELDVLDSRMFEMFGRPLHSADGEFTERLWALETASFTATVINKGHLSDSKRKIKKGRRRRPFCTTMISPS